MRKIAFIFLGLIFMAAFALWLKKELAIDSCLDHGGKWNYEDGICHKNL